jgi:hypothetical protein
MTERVMIGLILVLAVALAAGRADAAGVLLPSTGYVGDDPPTIVSQDAVAWIGQDGAWKLNVRACYEGDRSPFLWLIPLHALPAVPEVLMSENLFRDFDSLTAPTFFSERCYFPADGGCSDDEGPVEDLSEMQLDGQLASWQEGNLPNEGYSLIATAFGQDVIAWVQDKGYRVPADVAAVLEELQAEGRFFYAGEFDSTRLTAEHGTCLAPVTFSFKADAGVVYPLRLSAFSRAEEMTVRLWVVSDSGKPYVPTNVPWTFIAPAEAGTDRMTYGEYIVELDEVFSAEQEPELLLQFDGGLRARDGTFHDLAIPPGSAVYSASGLSTREVRDLMGRAGENVVRYWAALDPSGITQDVMLSPAGTILTGELPSWFYMPCSEVIREESGLCAAAGPPADGSSGRLPAAAPLALLLAGLLLIRFARRRRDD